MLLSLILILALPAQAAPDFQKAFADRDACFLVKELDTGKTVTQHGPKRCKERFTPCSSFKIAAALMAFEEGILQNENQTIPWDGVKRSRPEENKNQTPLTWMSDSVKWVTEWVMPQVGEKKIRKFLRDFQYGNQDFSGGLKDAWVTSSLKISAHEQANFLAKLWNGELPMSPKTIALTKKIIFLKKIGNAELFGKTGTGCLQGHACMEQPGKMIGTFVGVLKTPEKTYVIAANASDQKDQSAPAGPRLRKTAIELLEEIGLASTK